MWVFLTVLSAGATLLFGLLPALRASSTNPALALKGGDHPHSRQRLMYGLIATQVAFCFMVHFAADAFVTTLRRLSNQPTGFSSQRILILETVAKHDGPVEFWLQTADRLRESSGVESVAVADVPLLGDSTSNGFVSSGGSAPSPVLALFLAVSPGWLQTMKIPLLEGRDLRPIPPTKSPNLHVLASMLRHEITQSRPELRVSNVRTQAELNQAQTVRERLLAALAAFFAGVALLLAGIGLYGMLDYSVLRRRRELGIRIAVGATASEIARQVSAGMFSVVALGMTVGACAGLLLEPRIRALLYQVRPSDIGVLAVPLLAIVLITLSSAIPAIIRGIRIDPAEMLRTE